MFKRPVQVNLNTEDTTVTHRVVVDPATLRLINQKIAETGITVVVLTAAVLGLKVAADVVTHIVKTKIK